MEIKSKDFISTSTEEILWQSIRLNMTMGYFCQGDAFHLKRYNISQKNILFTITLKEIF